MNILLEHKCVCPDLTSLSSCSEVIWQKYSSEQTNIINGFLSLALLETHIHRIISRVTVFADDTHILSSGESVQ